MTIGDRYRNSAAFGTATMPKAARKSKVGRRLLLLTAVALAFALFNF